MKRYPSEPHWWFRWWMYPPNHRRRFIGIGSTWEYKLLAWIEDVKVRLTPGQCRECRAKNHLHKMRCSKLRGVPGKKLWSQDG